jgi:hypothetical protein
MKAIITYAKTEVVIIVSHFVLLLLLEFFVISFPLKHDTTSEKDLTFKSFFFFGI